MKIDNPRAVGSVGWGNDYPVRGTDPIILKAPMDMEEGDSNE